tara:strand:+ start:88 stop:684 length:597 start_codon:yes stop_codon:yes gene_type:complete
MSKYTDNTNSVVEFVQLANFTQNLSLLQSIFFYFIFVALFCQLVFSNFKSNDPYGSHGFASISIVTYCLVLFSMLSITLTHMISKINSATNDTSPADRPELFMIAPTIYILWLVSINVKYYKAINLRKVPPKFFLFANLTIIITAIQFMLVIALLLNPTIEANLKQKIEFLNILFSFLNFILILIQQIILDNFTVDIA